MTRVLFVLMMLIAVSPLAAQSEPDRVMVELLK